MRIGIQISSDLKQRTGVEEYIYQLLRHLPIVDDYKNHQFFIYSRKNLKWPFKWGWAQIKLSWEMLKNRPDVLFVPAHTFPLIHAQRIVVAIQGLEFERVPECYSFWQRKKLRFLTNRNAEKADKIIVPSECTKKDLIKFYRVNPKKIFVIHHGIEKVENCKLKIENSKRYILYLGSGHKRKNIKGLKNAYKILRDRYNIKHQLILAGIERHVAGEEKRQLLKNADVFVFPSFYEGFGFPVLEAQAAGVPVVASNISSLPEILGDSALLVDPYKPQEIAAAIYKILKNPESKQELIKKGQENIKRFSWLKCAKQTLKVLCE